MSNPILGTEQALASNAGRIKLAFVDDVGVDLATSNAVMTLVTFGSVGPTLGLLCGAPVTARPDHQKLIAESRQAAHEGRWTVVVHTAGDGERQRVGELLEAESGEISQTL